MVVARRALDVILGDLRAAAGHAAGLARTYRDTPMAGRTLMQQAVPTTFGLVAAQWLAGLSAATSELQRVRDQRLAAQLGGAAGTLASYGAAGVSMLERFAAEIGLAVPAAPWHTERSRVGEVAGALGTACRRHRLGGHRRRGAGPDGGGRAVRVRRSGRLVGDAAQAQPGRRRVSPRRRRSGARAGRHTAGGHAAGVAARGGGRGTPNGSRSPSCCG